MGNSKTKNTPLLSKTVMNWQLACPHGCQLIFLIISINNVWILLTCPEWSSRHFGLREKWVTRTWYRPPTEEDKNIGNLNDYSVKVVQFYPPAFHSRKEWRWYTGQIHIMLHVCVCVYVCVRSGRIIYCVDMPFLLGVLAKDILHFYTWCAITM